MQRLLSATQSRAVKTRAETLGWPSNLPSEKVLTLHLVPLTLLKLVQIFFTPPTPDEAYYWLWAQHPALSYFDHPPLVAWVLIPMDTLFGWNLFSLRAAPLATFLGCLWILWYWSKRLFTADVAMRAFLAGTLILLATPMLFRLQSLAHPDHLLIFFGMLTGHFWLLFSRELDSGRKNWTLYYLGCIALGFAGLSKYNAVFLGLGFAAWVLISTSGRPCFRSIHLWIGAALALLMQLPVLVWNLQHGWPSFQYNLEQRIGQSFYGNASGNLFHFIFWSVIMLGPAMVLALARFNFLRLAEHVKFAVLGRYVFFTSTVLFIFLCFFNTIMHYWNITAYLLFLPVSVLFFKNSTRLLFHAHYGVVTAIYLVVLQSVFPSYKVWSSETPGGPTYRDNDITYGQRELATVVEEEEARLQPDVVMTTDYRTASLLSFAAERTDILKIGLRNDQFDFWFDPEALKGKDALVLVDKYFPESELLTKVFEEVTPIREFTTEYYGIPMYRYRLVYAKNYLAKGRY